MLRAMNVRAPRGALVATMLIVSSLAGGGCGPGTPRGDHAAGGSTGGSATTPGPVAADTAFQRGSVRVRGDSLFFIACGSTAEAWLDDRTGGALARAVRSLGEGGQAVYLEMNGGAAGPGAVTAFEFLRAAPVGEGGGCGRAPGTYLYQAFGEEPFWSVHVWDDSLVFQQPDEPARIVWPSRSVTATRHEIGARAWTAPAGTGGQPDLELTIEHVPCSDGMSGEVTAFRARATLAGRALEGCARAGTAADEVR